MQELIQFSGTSFNSRKGSLEDFQQFYDRWIERRAESTADEYKQIAGILLDSAERFREKERKARLLRLLGSDAVKEAEYALAIRYGDEAKLLYQDLEDHQMVINCNNQLGRVYANLGDYSRAIDMLAESLRLATETNNLIGKANTLNAISVIYQRTDNAEKAEEMARQSMELAESTGAENLQAVALVNLGNAYGLKKDWAKAIRSWEKAILFFEKTGDEHYRASALGNIGIAYLRSGNLEKAEELLKQCHAVKERLNDVYDIARSLHNLGTVFAAQERYDEALDLYRRALGLGDSVKALSIHVMIYKDMIESLEKSGKYKEALETFHRYHDLQKQLFTVDMNLKTQTLEYRFEVERFEKENEIYRLKNIDLAEANRQIEQKNNDITASIRYAQRIQKALLPPSGAMRHGFSDAFVYYQPRDIVSGDFYWSMISDDAVLFAVADCTGHGVPGALMSVMGAAFLSEVINERGVTDPGEALNLLRLKVITALQSKNEQEEISEEQLRDGMDIVLCRFEPASRILSFACANNPLWLLRNGAITEFETDKFPVGLHHGQMLYFRSQQIELIPGDHIFLFTDGYADQFGGPEVQRGGKKFGYKRFRELLIGIGSLNSEEQKTILETKLREWKGDEEQVDDILVLGLAF